MKKQEVIQRELNQGIKIGSAFFLETTFPSAPEIVLAPAPAGSAASFS